MMAESPTELRMKIMQSAEKSPVSASGVWESVIPLGRDAAPPEFPVNVLPAWMGDFAAAEARAVHVPVDMPAVFALGALAASIGGFVRVRAFEQFEEGTNIYAVVAMPPSSVKSPVHRDATAPLAALELEFQERAAPQVRETTTRRAVAEKRLKRAEDDAAKAATHELAGKLRIADEIRTELDELGTPVLPRIIVDDTTPEQLKTLLCEHNGRLAMLSAESSLFGIMAGARYSADPNIEAMLAGHSGDRMQIDRRGRSERIERPALTVCIAVQPSVLRRAAENTIARERGLFARFLYCIPPSNVGRRDFSRPPEPVPASVISAYSENLSRIARLMRETPGKGGLTLHLSAAAKPLFTEFMVRCEERLSYGGDLAGIESWAGKLRGTALRLAGLIQVATGIQREVSAESMQSAIALAEYFTEHAKIAHDEMDEDEGVLLARKVLHWASTRARFTKDEARAAMKGRLKAAELDAVLVLLRTRNYLAENLVATGGRPATVYHLNPQVTGVTGARL